MQRAHRRCFGDGRATVTAELDATTFCGRQCRLGALRDHLRLVLSDGGEDVDREIGDKNSGRPTLVRLHDGAESMVPASPPECCRAILATRSINSTAGFTLPNCGDNVRLVKRLS